MQSALYGFNLTDAHSAYHSDVLHQTDRGVFLYVMEIISGILTCPELSAISAAVLSLKGFPLLSLPSQGFDVKGKVTATETRHLFHVLPVGLLAVEREETCDYISTCIGE